MRYRNTKTGAVIDSSFNISGTDWEIILAEVKEVTEEVSSDVVPDIPLSNDEEASESDPDEQTGNVDIDSLKKEDIIQELEAMGIKHNPRDKKQVLYDLMMSQGSD